MDPVLNCVHVVNDVLATHGERSKVLQTNKQSLTL